MLNTRRDIYTHLYKAPCGGEAGGRGRRAHPFQVAGRRPHLVFSIHNYTCINIYIYMCVFISREGGRKKYRDLVYIKINK